jgi:hypothetical protein
MQQVFLYRSQHYGAVRVRHVIGIVCLGNNSVGCIMLLCANNSRLVKNSKKSKEVADYGRSQDNGVTVRYERCKLHSECGI